jgi:hypothetical protein
MAKRRAHHQFRSHPSGLILPGSAGAHGPASRRQFVQTAGGILLGVGLGACGGGTDGIQITGNLRVTITGLGTGLADGGTALVTQTDISGVTPITILVPASGTGEGLVGVGTYHVIYTPPAGYQVVGANEFDVTVVADTLTVVNVTVQAIAVPGTLRVAVSGSVGASANRGTASLLRTDIGGQTPISVVVPLSGPIDTVVSAGTYQVTYTAPVGFHVNTGDPNPKTATVTASATTTVTFGVTVGGSVGDISEFGFEDGTFGTFRSGGNKSPDQVTVADPWVLDNTTAARGTTSMKHHVKVSAQNQGYDIYGPAFGATQYLQAAYIRFAYMQSNPFDNSFPIKVMRVQHDFSAISGSVMHNASGANRFQINPDDSGAQAQGAVIANKNLPAPRPNDFLGQWHFFEFYVNHVDATHSTYKLWVDDVQYFDYNMVLSAPRAIFDFNHFLFGTTLNGINQDGFIWYDQLGFGTQKMGVP